MGKESADAAGKVRSPMSERTWTLTIPAPADWLNSNKRYKRRPNDVIKAWKDAATVYARKAKVPKLAVVDIVATLHFTDRIRRDAPNYYPTIKAAIDGIVAAGVLVDDNNDHVRRLTIEPGQPIARKPFGPKGQLVLTLREVA